MATSTADLSFKAIKSDRFIQVRQALSGYALGWKRIDCWKIEVRIGTKKFVTESSYPSQKSALAAAKRLQNKFKDPQ